MVLVIAPFLDLSGSKFLRYIERARSSRICDNLRELPYEGGDF